MKTRLLIFTMLLFTQLGFSQWTKIGNDLDGEAAYDYFGDSRNLAISGDGTVVAISSDQNDNNNGHVKVYKNLNNVWTLVNTEINGVNSFGSEIELSNNGDIIAIGDPGNNNIKVLKNDNNDWVQKGNDISSIYNANIGHNLAMNAGGTVLATTLSDKIIIFKYINNIWTLNKEISLSGDRNFLASAFIEFNDLGDILVVGNRQFNGNNDGTEDGRVLIYENVNDDWSQKGSSIISNNNESYFGSSVDISGDGSLIVIGSPHTTVNGKDFAGFARTYKFENNDWVQVGSDINGLIDDIYIGRSVSLNIDGSILAVGGDGRGSSGSGRGIAQLYKFENNDWVQIYSTIVGEASKDAFGSSIVLNDSGSVVAIGGSDNDGNGTNSGHVRVYKDSSVPTSNYTTIPDAEFEQYLVQNNIDSEGTIDGQVLTADISSVTQIDVSQQNISDLTGIQNFTSLTYLNAYGNNISSIDVSNNILLEQLYLGDNQLSSIDITNNTKLLEFSISENNLTMLDVSKNTALTNLYVALNQLTSLDVFNNIKLIDVRCEVNSITTIDVTALVDLEKLWIFTNNFTQIDVSKNTKLKNFIAYQNNLTSLDLSKNENLEVVRCYSNQLTSLNIKNNNNAKIIDFEAQQNPDLLCIKVDDANASTNNNNWIKDPNSNYLENCGEGTFIPDVNFETYIESLGLGNTIIGDGYVETAKIAALTTLDVRNKNILDFTGIEDFVALKELDASDNNISTLDLTNNVDLEILNLFSNSISNIDLLNNSKLKELHIGANQLTNLDVSMLPELTKLWCFNNQLSTLDLSKNQKLEVLNCSTNQIENLNVYSNPLLTSIDVFSNKLKYFDIQNNKNLTQLSISDNELTSLNLKNDYTSKIGLFTSLNNPNLSCIKVDDVTWATDNLKNIDNTSSFSLDCMPFNDDCANAIPLTFGQQTPGDVNSGTSNNNPSCAVGTVLADVWFSVIVPQTGEFSIEGTGFGGQLKFAVYQTCSSLAPIACGTSISLKNLTVGTQFYLKVWLEASSNKSSVYQNNSGTFTLTASESSVLSVDQFIENKTALYIYPNPAETNISVQLSNNLSLEKVDIYSVLGDKIISKNGFNKSQLDINVSNLSTGIYIIRAKSEKGISSKKLIIK